MNTSLDPFNTFAEKAHAAGIVALLHNEGFDYQYIDGKPVYDMRSPARSDDVKLQFQVSTMQKGYDPVDLLPRYPGRYPLHALPGLGEDLHAKRKQVPLGKGVVDWKEVFTAAKKARIENYFVELEQDPALMPPSVPYLKSLQV